MTPKLWGLKPFYDDGGSSSCFVVFSGLRDFTVYCFGHVSRWVDEGGRDHWRGWADDRFSVEGVSSSQTFPDRDGAAQWVYDRWLTTKTGDFRVEAKPRRVLNEWRVTFPGRPWHFRIERDRHGRGSGVRVSLSPDDALESRRWPADAPPLQPWQDFRSPDDALAYIESEMRRHGDPWIIYRLWQERANNQRRYSGWGGSIHLSCMNTEGEL